MAALRPVPPEPKPRPGAELLRVAPGLHGAVPALFRLQYQPRLPMRSERDGLGHRPGYLLVPERHADRGGLLHRAGRTHGKGLPQNFYFTSYAGCYGQWASVISNPSASLQQQNGAIVSNGISPVFGFGTGFIRGGVVKIATITDGTSNTIAFGEHAHGLLSSTDPENSFHKWNWWVSGNYGDTAFTVFYPINVQKRAQNWDDGVTSGGYTEGGAFLNAATSFHPGGANFAFCDGSVRFLKDSISTWLLDNTGTPSARR